MCATGPLRGNLDEYGEAAMTDMTKTPGGFCSELSTRDMGFDVLTLCTQLGSPSVLASLILSTFSLIFCSWLLSDRILNDEDLDLLH